MNRRTLIAGAVSAAAMMQFGIVFAADAKGDPEKWILELSNEMLDAIRADAGLAKADPASIKKFVDEKVMPVVDFLRMTRMSVGPQWRQASPEQRTKLQELFREQLTRVYSGALAAVSNQKVSLAPSRVTPTETDAIVRTLMVEAGKQDLHINYRLKKVKGEWRIIDVDVEGIWLVDNYRTQFGSIVNQSGIEGLIKSLEEKNAAAGK